MKKIKIGDEVLCDWGSGGAGFVKKGVVVDNKTKYNNSLVFSPEGSEEACVIRFDRGEKTWDGNPLGANVVVPIRLIKVRGLDGK